ncbi:hypothetical protein I552_0753 [Mycobacterium xenopi 3993]|nr:hypothetical protein I552_0753 [Mycobacterium xenopi 3993]
MRRRPAIGHIPDRTCRADGFDLAGWDDSGRIVQQNSQRAGGRRRRVSTAPRPANAGVAAASLSTSRREIDTCHSVRQMHQLSQQRHWPQMDQLPQQRAVAPSHGERMGSQFVARTGTLTSHPARYDPPHAAGRWCDSCRVQNCSAAG